MILIFQNSELQINYYFNKGVKSLKVESRFIDVNIGCFEKVNEEFTKCTISVNSCDQIANGTKFREEAVENARPTLAYAPVIGYLKDDGTMGGHGIEFKITEDGGFEEVVKTVPFGVCIKGSDRWQMMTKPNGEQEKYMVVDCYLWNRYKKAIDIVKENKCNQSMEVNINDYEYKDSYLDIIDFSYSALCILGEDVTPAFNLAKIRTSDKFSKDEIKSCYTEMIEALDNFLNFEGGENMNEEDYKKKKCEDEDDEYKKKKCEDEEDEDFKKKKCSEDEDNEDNQEDYKKKKCEDDNEEDDEEYKKKKCEDDEDEEFKKKKCSEEEYEQQIITLKAEYSDLQAEYEALKEKYSTLESEVTELREYKKSKEDFEREAELEANVFSKFEALKKVEGYEDIYNKRFELSEDELNLRLKALAFDNGVIIKKGKTFSAKPEKKSLPIDNVKKDKGSSEWDLLNFKNK